MKKIDLAQTISILANLGVIAGIIFLAVEVRQNTTATQLMASGSASAYIRDQNRLLAENGELAALITKAGANDRLDETESLRLASFLSSTYVGWHAIHDQYDKGLLDEDLWRVHREGMRTVLHAYPFTREFWMRGRDRYSDEFNALMEQLVTEPPRE